MKFLGKSETTINITTRTIVKTIAIAVLAFMLFKVIGDISHQLRLIFISLFLAMALNPIVGLITSKIKSKSRLRATGAAYVLVLTVLIGFLSLVVPPLVNQTTHFVKGIPDTINNLKYQDSSLSRTIRRYGLQDKVDEIRDSYSERTSDLAKPAISTAGRIGGTIISFITVLVLTFMMLIEGPMWMKRFILMQPEKTREQTKRVVRRMYKVVTGYVNGQVLIAAIAAGFAAIVMFIMNAVFGASINPVALAGIVFVFGLIPMIGNIISAVVVVLACLISSFPLALFMGAYFLVYQQVENATLQPYIQSRSNQLTPLTIFIVALIGGGLGGILGALAAIPFAGCVKILLDEYVMTRFPNLESFDKHVKQ